MSKHTPGPYTVEKAVVRGYRGGNRHIGWWVVRNGKQTSFFKFKATAVEHADKCNAAVQEATSLLPRPYGWHCELVHVASGEVIRDTFIRDAPITGPDEHVQGFEWRATPVAAIAKATGEPT